MLHDKIFDLLHEINSPTFVKTLGEFINEIEEVGQTLGDDLEKIFTDEEWMRVPIKFRRFALLSTLSNLRETALTTMMKVR